MSNIYKAAFAAVTLLTAQFAMVNAESSCVLCDNVRADTAANHKNYEYYEDYLNATKGSSRSAKGKLSENIRANRKNKMKANNNNESKAKPADESPEEAPSDESKD